MSDLPYRSPISISHIDIGSYLVTLASDLGSRSCSQWPFRQARLSPIAARAVSKARPNRLPFSSDSPFPQVSLQAPPPCVRTYYFPDMWPLQGADIVLHARMGECGEWVRVHRKRDRRASVHEDAPGFRLGTCWYTGTL